MDAAPIAVVPPVDPAATQLFAAQVVEPTQRLATAVPPVESTQRFEAAAAPVASTQRLEQTKSPDTAPPWPPPDDRGSGRSRKPLAYAALLVAALGVAYLLTQLGDQGGTTAIRGTTSVTAPATSATQGSPTAQATSANTASTGASTSA